MPGSDVMQGWAIWTPVIAMVGTAIVVALGLWLGRRGPRG